MTWTVHLLIRRHRVTGRTHVVVRLPLLMHSRAHVARRAHRTSHRGTGHRTHRSRWTRRALIRTRRTRRTVVPWVTNRPTVLLVTHVHGLLTGHGLTRHRTRNLLGFATAFRLPSLLLGARVLRRRAGTVLRTGVTRARDTAGRRRLVAVGTHARSLTQNRRLTCGKTRIRVVPAAVIVHLNHQPQSKTSTPTSLKLLDR